MGIKPFTVRQRWSLAPVGGDGGGLRHRTPARWAAVALVAVGALLAGIAPVDAAPIRLAGAAGDTLQVHPDAAAVVRGSTVRIYVLANDSGLGGVGLNAPQVSVSVPPTQGTAVVRVDGSIDYTARPDAGPSDSFTYQVREDGTVGSAQVEVSIGNADPVAVDDQGSITSSPGTALSIDVLANDSDPDGGTLLITSVSTPTLGTVAPSAGVRLVYDPKDGASGSDEFTYQIADGQGGSAVGRVHVIITAPTPTPTPAPTTPSPRPRPRSATARLGGSVALGDSITTFVTTVGIAPAGARAHLVLVQSGSQIVLDTASLTAAGTALLEWQTTQAISGISPDDQVRTLDLLVTVVAADGVKSTAATGKVRVTSGVNVRVSGGLTRADVPRSYRPGCPVRPASLRRMTMNYWSYSGELKRGSLVVRTDSVQDLVAVFSRAFRAGFRIKRITPIETYYKSGRRSPTAADKASMAAGNTSAFNCRSVVGNPFKRSAHSYGVAVDINTFENPYVTNSRVYPAKARRYLKRTPCRRGMICRGGVIPTAMRAEGWLWGARWSRPDYQHFSSTGG